jgi:hypothetical protein
MSRLLLSIGLVLAAPAALADSVGRTEFALPNAEWRLLVSYDRALKFDRGLTSIPLRASVYMLPGRDAAPIALLQVTSSEGGSKGPVRWISDRCPEPRPHFYTNDLGSNTTPNKRECVIVNSRFSPSAYFADHPEVNKALADQHVALFKGGYSMRSTSGSNNGTYLVVNLMTTSAFQGLAGDPPAGTDLHAVPPALVVWAEALHAAVRDSTLSMRGSLALPPISFEPR